MSGTTYLSKDLFKRAGPGKAASSRWFGASKKSRPMALEDAFLAILIGAARADGVIGPQETEEIAALVSRTRAFSSETPQQIARRQKELSVRIEVEGLFQMLSAACAAILSQKREEPAVARTRAESVFAHAVDLVLVDGLVNVHEKEYIEALADQLSIDPNRALQIVSVMEVRNSFSVPSGTVPSSTVPTQAGLLALLDNWITEYEDRADPDLDEQLSALEQSKLQFEQP
jgi:tellurite resistance protein